MAVEKELEGAFGLRDEAHFTWQTENPVVARNERALTCSAFMPVGKRVLDLGCAEGATLLHLGEPEGAVGVDLFEDKLAFARERVPSATFVKATGYELPFDDARFDHVVVRDVLHHMDHPERAVAEIFRVLEPGGRVDVLEPCGRNPLVFAHAVMNPAERGELRSTPSYLRGLFAREFPEVSVKRYQAFPIHRIVFHPKMGSPALAHRGMVTALVDSFERLADKIVPEALFAYIHVRAHKR